MGGPIYPNLIICIHETTPQQKRKTGEGQFHHHEQNEGSNLKSSPFAGSCGCN